MIINSVIFGQRLYLNVTHLLCSQFRTGCCHWPAAPSQWSAPNGRTLPLPSRVELMNKIERGWWAINSTFLRQNKPFFPIRSDQERAKWSIWRLVTSDAGQPGLDVRSCAQGRVWEDFEVTEARGRACSHPGVIWYHQYRVKPSSIFCSIPIINCLPHQEPGREDTEMDMNYR